MKQCQKCKRVFEDTAFYCPECGEELKAYVQAPQTTVQANNASAASAQPGQAEKKDSDSTDTALGGWLATVLGIVGLLICWYVSALFGMAIAVVGGLSGWKSSNIVNKLISTVAAVVSIILYFEVAFA